MFKALQSTYKRQKYISELIYWWQFIEVLSFTLMSQKPKSKTKIPTSYTVSFKELTLDHKQYVFLGQEAPEKRDLRW